METEKRVNQLAVLAAENNTNPAGTLTLKRTPGEVVGEKWKEVIEDGRYDEVMDAIDNRKYERTAAHDVRMAQLAADKEEAEGRMEKVKKVSTVDDGVAEEIRNNPSIVAAVNELTLIVGETRAKEVVYGGLQHGWRPSGSGSNGDPFSDLGKTLIEPVIKAMGENIAETMVHRKEVAVNTDSVEEKVGEKPSDTEAFFKKRATELAAEEAYLAGLKKRREEIMGLEQNPVLNRNERADVGFQLNTLQDHIIWTKSQQDHDIAMFRMQEESRMNWAKYLDEKGRAGIRDGQVDKALEIAKDNLPDAISAGAAAANSLRGTGTDEKKPAKGKKAGRIQKDDGKADVECPWCGENNVVEIGTKEFDCVKCEKKCVIGPANES